VNTHRGYTLHEHLDELGVIHMNGRIYDPLVGRFMSADPYIQAPQNLQSHNRYAYVMNNPLALTDPSGYFSWGKLFGAMLCPICVKEWQRPILIIGLSVASGQWFISLGWAPVAAGAASGFITGFASTGNLNGAIQGGLTGGLFGAAGSVGADSSIQRYVAHAAAGCVSAVAGSGSCGSGAAAAVFGKYTTNAIGDSSILSDPVSKGVASAVAGGVGSVIAGGKFENGAVTAAYGYLFNAMMSDDGWGRPKTLEDHFNRHGADFDAKSASDYAQKAQEFRERALNTQGTEFRIDADGTLRIYDRATNTFASYNADGSTKTFYKPRAGENYWDAPQRVKEWGEKIDANKPNDLSKMGRTLRVIRIIGGNLE